MTGNANQCDTAHAGFGRGKVGRRGIVGAAAIAAMGFTGAAAQADILIQPDEASSKDAFVYEGAANFTTGSAVILGASQADGHTTHSFIQFDLTGVTLETGQTATLGLYVQDNTFPGLPPTAANPVIVDVYATTGSWNESTVSWNTQPTYSTTLAATAQIAAIDQWVTFDITDLVADWLDGSVTNRGLTLVERTVPSPDTHGAEFQSSGGVNRPYLAIPEPTTAALLGLGVPALFLRRRR